MNSENSGLTNIPQTFTSCQAFPWRSMALGLGLVVLMCWVSPYEDMVLQSMIAGGHSAPILASIFFLALVAANGMVRKLFGAGLSGHELAVVFCMLLVASGIPSMGMADYLLPTLIAPFYYATEANEWASFYHPHIPDWLVPSKDGSSAVVLDFVNGGSSVPWRAWIPCLFWWSTFLLAFYLATVSLCALFSESWIRHERLNFPLIELPLSVFKGSAQGTWRKAVFLAGLAVPLVIYSWNIVGQRYLTDMPRIPLGTDLRTVVGGSCGVFSAWIYPALVGFFYFVPTTVTCGIWVCFLFMKLQRGAGAWLGTDIFTKGGQNYGGSSELHQAIGAMVALLACWAWVARKSLAAQFRLALEKKSWAPWGFLLGFGYVVGFFWVAGLSLWAGLFYFGAFLLIALVLTRLVVQAGLPYVQSAFVPTDMMRTAFGTGFLGAKDMSLLGLHFPLGFDMAGFMMPSVFHSLKVAEELRISRRWLLLALALAILVALPVSFGSFLTLTYEHGGSAKTSWWFYEGSPKLPFDHFMSMARHSKGTDWHGISFTAAGVGLATGLLALLYRYPGWPIHPLGYVLAGTWVIQLSWFSCFLAWAAKVVIVRFGGGRGFHAAAPFFLGMVLGGFVTSGLWALIDLATNVVGSPVPTFPP